MSLALCRCVRFLEAAQDGAPKELLCGAMAALLHLCLTLPDLNAKLRRGEMWVLSQAQASCSRAAPSSASLTSVRARRGAAAQLAPARRGSREPGPGPGPGLTLALTLALALALA